MRAHTYTHIKHICICEFAKREHMRKYVIILPFPVGWSKLRFVSSKSKTKPTRASSPREAETATTERLVGV